MWDGLWGEQEQGGKLGGLRIGQEGSIDTGAISEVVGDIIAR